MKTAPEIVFTHYGSRRDCAATNAPGTCLWCGTKLRAYRWREQDGAVERGMQLGGYGDNAFCTVRCAACFGLSLAKLGRRLTPGTKASA